MRFKLFESIASVSSISMLVAGTAYAQAPAPDNAPRSGANIPEPPPQGTPEATPEGAQASPSATPPATPPRPTAVAPQPPLQAATPTYQTPVAGAPRSGANIGPATPPGVAPTEQGVFPPTPPQFTIETADHVNRLRLGVLIQGQYEAHGASGSQGLTQNLYIRRAGILLGGRALK